MIEPGQAEFRRGLRARTRPPAPEVDDDWSPHPRWDILAVEKRKTGPPQMKDPSPSVLAARRYRERQRQAKRAGPSERRDPGVLMPRDLK